MPPNQALFSQHTKCRIRQNSLVPTDIILPKFTQLSQNSYSCVTGSSTHISSLLWNVSSSWLSLLLFSAMKVRPPHHTWKLGTIVNVFHNSNFTPFSAQAIPADRKHAGCISTSSSLSSCRKHKGDTRGLAINWWDLTASACWGLTALKRGVVPVQIWINSMWQRPWATESTQGATPVWTYQLLHKHWSLFASPNASTVPTNPRCFLSLSDPRRG